MLITLRIEWKMKNKFFIITVIILGILLIGNLYFIIGEEYIPDTGQSTASSTSGTSVTTAGIPTVSSKVPEALNEKVETEQDISEKLGLNKDKEAKGKDIMLTRKAGEEKTRIEFEESGGLTLNGNAVTNVKGIESGKKAYVVVDKNGEVVEAEFETTAEGDYIFGNEKWHLPKGTKVSFKDGKCNAVFPKGVEIKAPQTMKDGENGKSLFYFRYEDNSAIPLSNGAYKFYGTLIYKNKNIYFDDGARLEFSTGTGTEIITLNNREKVLTRIGFDGEYLDPSNWDGAYFSINKNKKTLIVGQNGKGTSPSVRLQSNSIFIPDMEGESDFVEFLAYSSDGKLSFIHATGRSEQLRSGRFGTLNGFALNWDGGSTFFNDVKNELLISQTPIISGEVSKGYVPLRIDSYKYDQNNQIVCAMVRCDIVVQGNDGRIGAGPDAIWVPVKGEPYKGYTGFYHGASELLSYYEGLSENTFERFTGINLIDQSGLIAQNPQELKVLMDVIGSVPRENLINLDEIYLKSRAMYSGMATTSGSVYLNVGRYDNEIPIRTAFHELGHMRDFYVAYGSGRTDFSRVWRALGGYDGPQKYWYGYHGGESTSTFREGFISDKWHDENSGRYFGSWNVALSEEYSYYKQIRGRVAAFYKYGFVTQDETQRVFDIYNTAHPDRPKLQTDTSSIEKYIQEGMNG